jgi:Arc/MetJ-type ribon-helix-helix transcriptional regulator
MQKMLSSLASHMVGTMKDSVRTTFSIPADLLRAADQAVKNGAARNRNEFVTLALQHELASQKRAQIDAAFAGMADDAEYLQEALTLAEGFVVAEWDAFVQTETHP